jgi:hypothetical protein
LGNAQTALSRQYYICNQASDTVSRAESDLRAANLKLQTEQKFLSDAKAKLTAALARKKTADDLVNKLLSSSSTSTSTGGSSVRIGGGISGFATGNLGSGSTLSIGVSAYTPTPVGSIGDYLGRVYGSDLKTFWEPYSSSSAATTYSTMYPLSTTTVNALYGRSDAGVFLPSGSTYLSGITSNPRSDRHLSHPASSATSTAQVQEVACNQGTVKSLVSNPATSPSPPQPTVTSTSESDHAPDLNPTDLSSLPASMTRCSTEE